MPTFKNPLDLSDEILREARKQTLNKRINQKGNYENYINGGSHAINNQSKYYDRDENVAYMYVDPAGAWAEDEWSQELNDRYTNPQHNERAGNTPLGEDLKPKYKYIHRYTPSTKRGRRASDIFFQAARNGQKATREDLENVQRVVNKYEGRK